TSWEAHSAAMSSNLLTFDAAPQSTPRLFPRTRCPWTARPPAPAAAPAPRAHRPKAAHRHQDPAHHRHRPRPSAATLPAPTYAADSHEDPTHEQPRQHADSRRSHDAPPQPCTQGKTNAEDAA